jgi:hypothetical protein
MDGLTNQEQSLLRKVNEHRVCLFFPASRINEPAFAHLPRPNKNRQPISLAGAQPLFAIPALTRRFLSGLISY